MRILHAKSMESVPSLFQRFSVSKPLLVMTHMPISGDVTLARLLRSEVIMSIICGLLHIAVISSENTIAISMLSPLHQSRLSNTSTNMSTKVMITLQWSLVAARMKSSCTLMPDMSLPVKVSGRFFTSTCIRKALQLFVFKSILKVNRPLPGIKILPQTFRLYLTGMQLRIPG